MKILLLLTILGSNLADPIDSGLYKPDHSGLYQPDNSGQYLLDHTGLYVPGGLQDVEDGLEEEHENEDLKGMLFQLLKKYIRLKIEVFHGILDTFLGQQIAMF